MTAYPMLPAMNDQIYSLAEKLGTLLARNKLMLTTAESCTGGGVGYALTAIPGSSVWYSGGIVAYCNDLKKAVLGVDGQTLDLYGAVSENVAREMQSGALKVSGADVSISTTGIAGPGGGTKEKPTGTVCFAFGTKTQQNSYTRLFEGDRDQVRLQAIEACLMSLIQFLDNQNTV
ncbi:Nicotinamide-nucleotide amidohydrolase PncC [Thalassocella blandensis]|nr:Nicotinamide-nucleotide amidohydrolase PncC [Thalassocella blandensis]